MQALILAGGLGTRLRPLKLGVPKPMAKVSGMPFLERLILRLKNGGVTKILLLVGYKKKAIEKHFGNGKKLGIKIGYSREQRPLGTGGAIKNAQKSVEKQFLLFNGDTICDIDIQEFIKFHKKHKSILTIAVSRAKNEGGKIELATDLRVAGFGKKGPFVNAGAYVANSEILKTIPANKKVSFEEAIIPRLLTKRVFGFRIERGFLDIGTPSRYSLANRVIK
ncbi:NTP transferase domain-containing protein [Candidatus Micrarchaeota archaeon]|nr:NTP transferase domain-containing protein [Candidatus Micrarchaeota archaeon]